MSDRTSLINSIIFAFNNIGTSPVPVAPLNPNRKKLTFCVAGGAVDVVVFPTTAYAGLPQPSGNSVTLTPSVGALGGGFRVFAAGGTVVIDGQASKQAWQALALSGSGNPLTVMEET